MRGVRAIMVCLVAPLALRGCVHPAGPVVLAQSPGDHDTTADAMADDSSDTVLGAESWL